MIKQRNSCSHTQHVAVNW